MVAVGDCARTCGVFKGSYAVVGSVDQIIPVDVFVDGCPPEPADILRGILAAIRCLPPIDLLPVRLSWWPAMRSGAAAALLVAE